MVEVVLGIKPRDDEKMALEVLESDPEFFGENLAVVRKRIVQFSTMKENKNT